MLSLDISCILAFSVNTFFVFTEKAKFRFDTESYLCQYICILIGILAVSLRTLPFFSEASIFNRTLIEYPSEGRLLKTYEIGRAHV